MNRMQFIQNMSIFGVGTILTPWKLATAEPSIQRFRFPPASVHIPHGNFATAEVEKLIIPELDLECSTQLFMRNGITPCSDDLTVYSFQRGKEFLYICFTTNGQSFTKGDIKGLKVAVDSSNREMFSVTKI